jgi:hypothetical protein
MPDLRLSILDQSPIPEGCTAGDALRNSIDLARLADSLGYTRFRPPRERSLGDRYCDDGD